MKVKSKNILKLRTNAFLVDIVAITIITKTTIWTYGVFLKNFFSSVPQHFQNILLAKLPLLEILILLIIFWGYFTYCYYMMDGQSPGKVIFNLKVTNEQNQPLTFKESLLRVFGYFLCYFSGAFLFLVPWLNKNQKGIPDWLSKTKVIMWTEARASNKQQPLSKEALTENKYPLIISPGNQIQIYKKSA